MGISPWRKILCGVKQQPPAENYYEQGEFLQSFVLLVVLKTAATKNTVLTPAPTEASVKATSTAAIIDQRRHIIKLYAPNRIAVAKRSFTVMAAMAQTITSVRIARSNCQIIGYSLCIPFSHGFSPALTPASMIACVAVGLEMNTKVTISMIFILVRTLATVKWCKLKTATEVIISSEPKVSSFPAG